MDAIYRAAFQYTDYSRNSNTASLVNLSLYIILEDTLISITFDFRIQLHHFPGLNGNA